VTSVTLVAIRAASARAFFGLRMSFFGKPVPTFPGHALKVSTRNRGTKTLGSPFSITNPQFCDHQHSPLNGAV